MIKGIIFDLDGTLFDSMSIWQTAVCDYIRSLGLVPTDTLREETRALSLPQAAEYLRTKYQLPLTQEEVGIGINKTVEAYYVNKAEPKKSVISFLENMQKRNVKMCIATATDRYLIEIVLKRFDMLGYFSEIFTCTSVGHSKLEPYIFEYAQKFLGVEKSEAVVFEDAYHAAKTAKDAGFKLVGIYDRFENHTDKLKEIADIYINDYSEIEKLMDEVFR